MLHKIIRAMVYKKSTMAGNDDDKGLIIRQLDLDLVQIPRP